MLTTIIPILILTYCTIRIVIALRLQKSVDLLLGKKTSENGSSHPMNGTKRSSPTLTSERSKNFER